MANNTSSLIVGTKLTKWLGCLQPRYDRSLCPNVKQFSDYEYIIGLAHPEQPKIVVVTPWKNETKHTGAVFAAWMERYQFDIFSETRSITLDRLRYNGFTTPIIYDGPVFVHRAASQSVDSWSAGSAMLLSFLPLPVRTVILTVGLSLLLTVAEKLLPMSVPVNLAFCNELLVGWGEEWINQSKLVAEL